MCQGPKPLLSKNIYRLRADEDSGFVKPETSSSVPRSVNADFLHEQLKPLRISDCSENTASATSRVSTAVKWSCKICTYENWPKSRKCIMCGTSASASNTSPTSGQLPLQNQASPNNTSVRLTSPSPEKDATINEDNTMKRSNSRREDIGASQTSMTNNYEFDRRRREADWTWLNACLGVVEGDPNPVAKFLSTGGDPTRQLLPAEVSLLNRPSAFDIGHTLVHLAIRFHREEMLAMLVSSIDGGGSGLKRVPSYIAPELASAIRRHAATIFNTKHSRSIPFPFITEFTTFVLPADIEDLPASVQEQLFDELLDKDVQQQLESEPAVINWSVEITVQLGSRLHALWNRSQGDCLLDSLMQATWGVFDRDSLLRRALADSLCHGAHLLYPRWLESEANQARQLDFTLSDSQWAEDWSALVKRATQPGASLQQLHVFALAHVLRRPVLVYGVKFVKSFRGEALDYAGFEGVYLPLLWEPSFCSTSPVALGYTRGHFSALVPMECYSTHTHSDLGSSGIVEDNRGEQVCYLPLVDRDRKILPIHFLTKSETGSEERLLRRWLDVNITNGGLLVAQQRVHGRPLLVAQMLQEWLNHYKSLAQMSGTPYSRTIPTQDFSSDGDTDDE